MNKQEYHHEQNVDDYAFCIEIDETATDEAWKDLKKEVVSHLSEYVEWYLNEFTSKPVGEMFFRLKIERTKESVSTKEEIEWQLSREGDKKDECK